MEKSVWQKVKEQDTAKKDLAEKLYELVSKQGLNVHSALDVLEITKNKILFNTVV